jgi:hypothetical protein
MSAKVTGVRRQDLHRGDPGTGGGPSMLISEGEGILSASPVAVDRSVRRHAGRSKLSSTRLGAFGHERFKSLPLTVLRKILPWW